MAAYDDDDVLVGKQSQPVTITLLIVGCIALICAITLSVKQLSVYVNPQTRSTLNNFQMTAVQYAESQLPPEEGGPADPMTAERDF